MKILGIGSTLEINDRLETVKRITKEFVSGKVQYFVYTDKSKYCTSDLAGAIPEVAFTYSEGV